MYGTNPKTNLPLSKKDLTEDKKVSIEANKALINVLKNFSQDTKASPEAIKGAEALIKDVRCGFNALAKHHSVKIDKAYEEGEITYEQMQAQLAEIQKNYYCLN
jgi:hypothetical protein